jgi:hypothetical protein
MLKYQQLKQANFKVRIAHKGCVFMTPETGPILGFARMELPSVPEKLLGRWTDPNVWHWHGIREPHSVAGD